MPASVASVPPVSSGTASLATDTRSLLHLCHCLLSHPPSRPRLKHASRCAQGLDLSGSVRTGSSEDLLYDCFGVSNHIEGRIPSSDHYTAYCAEPVATQPGEQAWHLFDDSAVSPATPDQVVSSEAYVLFYRRRSSSCKDPADLIERCQCAPPSQLHSSPCDHVPWAGLAAVCLARADCSPTAE